MLIYISPEHAHKQLQPPGHSAAPAKSQVTGQHHEESPYCGFSPTGSGLWAPLATNVHQWGKILAIAP